MVTCNSPFDVFMEEDVFQWFFTRTTVSNANMVNTSNTDKYSKSGTRNHQLTVNNINSSDEGYYYCWILRNGMLQNDRFPGACLYVYRK